MKGPIVPPEFYKLFSGPQEFPDNMMKGFVWSKHPVNTEAGSEVLKVITLPQLYLICTVF